MIVMLVVIGVSFQIALQLVYIHHIQTLSRRMKAMSIEVDALVAKVDELVSVEAAREARDIAQDTITQAQIATLQTTINELRAVIENGTLSPADVASLLSASAKVQSTIDSLNAADPTAPVV